MSIAVTCPYPLDSQKGNAISALRIVHLLQSCGQPATAVHQWQADGSSPLPEVLIALHALKSSASMIAYRAAQPAGKIVLYLTGTDIYGGQEKSPALWQQMLEIADVLVISQPASLDAIASHFHPKVHVIYTSAELAEPADIQLPSRPYATVIGHLREVKNPFLAVRALQLVADLQLEIHHLGAALDDEMKCQALDWQQRDPRYHWHGNVDRPALTSWLKNSHFTINSSWQEGGANAISEAIICGTPVLASHIPANCGMLGEHYAGFFDPSSAEELSQLMKKSLQPAGLISQLRQQIGARQPLFSSQTEANAWLAAVGKSDESSLS